MPPRTVSDDPEQLWGDSSMIDRKRDEALKEVLVEGDINPFEALNLPTPSIAEENALSKATIDRAYRSMMKEHHPDRYRLKIKKERGHSPDADDLESSVIKMRNATSAREALTGALELKSRGMYGVFILKHCDGRLPQEYAQEAVSQFSRINLARARLRDQLDRLQRSANAASDREKRESNLAAQREHEETERAKKTLNQQRLNEAAHKAAESQRRLRAEYMRSSAGKEGKNPYGLPLRPKSAPPPSSPYKAAPQPVPPYKAAPPPKSDRSPFTAAPLPRGSAGKGGVCFTQYGDPTQNPSSSSRSSASRKANIQAEHGSRWRGKPPPPKKRQQAEQDAIDVPPKSPDLDPRPSTSAQDEGVTPTVAPASDPESRRDMKANSEEPGIVEVDLEASPTNLPSAAPESFGPQAQEEAIPKASGHVPPGMNAALRSVHASVSQRARKDSLLTRGGREIAKRTADNLRAQMPAQADIMKLPKKGTLTEEARERERQTLAEQQARTSVQERSKQMFAAAQTKYAQEMADYEEAIKAGSSPALPKKPSKRGHNAWQRNALRAATHRIRETMAGAKRRREDEAAGPSAKAKAVRRKKQKDGPESQEWSKYRREQQEWKPPDPPLLRRKASSNIDYKRRRAARRLIIKRLHKMAKRPLALTAPPPDFDYSTTPEPEVEITLPADPNPAFTIERRIWKKGQESAVGSVKTPLAERQSGPWSRSKDIHESMRFQSAYNRRVERGLGQTPRWQRTSPRTTDLVRNLAPDAPSPDNRVVLTPRSSDSPRVSKTPEREKPPSTVTYSRDDDDESMSQVSDCKTIIADPDPSSDGKTVITEPESVPSPDRTPGDEMPEESTSASMSSEEYRQWLIEERARIWDKFATLNPGWKPKSDDEGEA